MKSMMTRIVCSTIIMSAMIFGVESPDCTTVLTPVLVPHGTCTQSCDYGKTFFSIRPQDSNSANRLVRVVNEDHSPKEEAPFSWGFDFTVGVQQNFASLLGKWFLFNNTDQIVIGIPSAMQRFDVDGRQFGLLTESNVPGVMGTLSLNPTIQNVISNINFWFDLNKIIPRAWARTYFTVARAKNELHERTCADNIAQSGNYPDMLYTTSCGVVTSVTYTNICSAFKGNLAFGDMPPLNYGKFCTNAMKKMALASIRVDLGFDIVRADSGYCNTSICFLAPTGNATNGRWVFEHVVGAIKCWQIGVESTGAYSDLFTWGASHLGFYADVTLTHLFKAQQTRVFALKNNGAGSQYLLLKNFDLSIGSVLQGQRVANVFAGQAEIGANVMLDGSVMVRYNHVTGFFCDAGYNLWLRSKETLGNEVYFRNFALEAYGIKGNLPLTQINEDSGFCIGNLETASHSTIGQPADADGTSTTINVCDVDFDAPLHPFTFSNKIFAALGYSRALCNEKLIINTSLEGEVEFGQKHTALNQWAVNVNIGISL